MDQEKTYNELVRENESLSLQLEEATEIINAIRTGQIDALVVQGEDGGHELYTLKTADQTYRVFIETMNEGAVTLNDRGIILYCNSMFASMVNVNLSKVIGLPFASFIPEESKIIYDRLIRSGWIEDTKLEIMINGVNGLVPCQLSVTTLQLDEGISLSIIITDLTSQKETQKLLKLNNERLEEINAALEASNHDLQQFASVASHDLQEPLRKILIFSTLLKEKHMADLPKESGVYLNKILSSSDRMRTMIIDILSYSRLSKSDQIFVATNLTDIVNDVLEDFEILIQEKKAKIVVDKLPKVEINRGQIRQVFQNLIGNALKFSKTDELPVIGISCISAERIGNNTEEEACTISISDNGIGFNEDYRDKIFSLFQRLNTKDKYEGSGIGLAITKKIIDKHNGTIKANSREGIGSQFIIQLPLRQNRPDRHGS